MSPAVPPLASSTGEQVGQDLAGVVVVGERVDHGHPGVRRHLLERALLEGAPHDRGRLRAEDAGDVGHRLAHPHTRQAAVDDHREAAEPGDRADERHLGAQGRLVEQDRDRARALEAAVGVRRGLERERAVEHGPLLGGGEVVVGEEVAQVMVIGRPGVAGAWWRRRAARAGRRRRGRARRW